ncbi:MAG: hypothetical protein WC178_00030 [Candidatus Paceibacterota bacterium]
MQKSFKKRFKNILKDIDKKSEAEKNRLVLFLSGFSVFCIFCLWLITAGNNFSELGKDRIDLSALPEFPQVDSIDIGDVLQKSEDTLDGFNQINNTLWQESGDRYISEKNILKDDEFSVLKLADVQNMDDSVFLEYEHYYKDVLVLGSDFGLMINTESQEITEKTNNLKLGISLAVDPEISVKKAMTVAEEEIDDDSYVFDGAKLAIASYEENLYLVWKIVFDSEADDNSREILVGAKYGSIIPDEMKGENQTSDMVK